MPYNQQIKYNIANYPAYMCIIFKRKHYLCGNYFK
jgi:hypothetical protein